MLRQLPPTITADQTPDWLPVGWIAHSTVLKRGRQTRTYTELRTGKKFSTKDQVLEYIKMVKVREEREFGVRRKKLKAFQDSEATRERASRFQDDWKTEPRVGSFGHNSDTMPVNTSNVFKTPSKEEVLLHQNVIVCGSSSDEEEEFGCNQISYLIEEDEEDFLESEDVEDKASRENVENFSNITTASLRSQPVRVQKLESRAKTQCVFEDEDMSSDSDIKFPEVNASGEAGVGSNLVEPLEELSLHNAVVEYEDKTRDIPSLTGSFTIEINLDCEPASDSMVEKDWTKSGIDEIGTRNIAIRDQESDLMHMDKTCFSENMKEKDNEAPTKSFQKGKTRPSRPKGKKGSLDIEPCPNFPFEPLTSSSGIEDDSVIRRYLEEYSAAGVANSDLPLPDFGLPSFSNIKISLNEEPGFKKKKSPDPPGAQVASSSEPNCSSMGITVQTVAGN